MPEVIILPILFICIAYTMVSLAQSRQRSHRDAKMVELASKMIDKMGAGADIVAFASSDAFRNLLVTEPLAADAPLDGSRGRILNSLQAGSVIAAVGTALLLTAGWVRGADGRTGAAIAGSVFLAAGAALLGSSLVAVALLNRWNGPKA
jgi:hypothetical protein